MAVADRYSGANLRVFFKRTGGSTADLSGDFRSLDVTRDQETWDATAAADGARVNKPTVKAFGASLETMYTGTAGTPTFAIAELGAEGVFEYAPEGTASGKPKGAFPAIITKQPFSTKYDDGTMSTIEFAGQGMETSNPFVDVY